MPILLLAVAVYGWIVGGRRGSLDFDIDPTQVSATEAPPGKNRQAASD